MELHRQVWQASITVRFPDGSERAMAIQLACDTLPTVYWVERAVGQFDDKLTVESVNKLDRMPPVAVV